MTPEEIEQAATLRAAGMHARADRPRQRRAAEDRGSRPLVRAHVAGLQLREAENAGGGLSFRGVASVTEAPYAMWDMFGGYTEVVSAGAFATTLRTEGLDVPLVLAHDQLRRIARTTNGTLTLAETTDGLDVAAELDPSDADVAYIAPKLRAGLIDEMSFAFSVTAGVWSPDYSEYRISAVDIHRGDVAIVGFGANPATTANVRAGRNLTDADILNEMRARGLGGPGARSTWTRAHALAVLDAAL